MGNFFVPLRRHLTSNQFTFKDSFEFAKIICQQDAGLFMASLDVDSLFTLLRKPSIFVLMSYSKVIVVFMVLIKQITDIFSLTTKESVMLFDLVFYTQVDSVAMGYPLGPSSANAFLCHHETKCVNDCPEKSKPVFYKRYVDDIFALFKEPEHVKLLVYYMNSKHQNINFSFKTAKDEQMPFLDVNLFRENGQVVTNLYRKETFTGVYTNFPSFIPLEHKFGLVYTLLYRCFCLVSDMLSLKVSLFYLTDVPTNSLINGFRNL